MTTTWPPPGWTLGRIAHGKHEHAYYVIAPPRSGDAASLLLLHEFPGINDALVTLAEELADSFRVVVPSIVGRDGNPSQVGTAVRLCIRKEVHAFALGVTSPAVSWLRDLVDEVVSPDGDPFGVIGMCMTGGFALALAVDKRVRAAVVAQPALPVHRLRCIPLPRSLERAADLGLSPVDRAALARTAHDGDLCARALRYRDDWISPAARLDSVEGLLGDAVGVFTLTGPNVRKHATLTGDERDDTAVREVVQFLRERLAAPS
ncbi:MAG: dienelactone hydrolase [Pseudonocardiales bacterium]|nr:MAG: dienelactone hydrolase [Pseudonocardiales bacterium]